MCLALKRLNLGRGTFEARPNATEAGCSGLSISAAFLHRLDLSHACRSSTRNTPLLHQMDIRGWLEARHDRTAAAATFWYAPEASGRRDANGQTLPSLGAGEAQPSWVALRDRRTAVSPWWLAVEGGNKQAQNQPCHLYMSNRICPKQAPCPAMTGSQRTW